MCKSSRCEPSDSTVFIMFLLTVILLALSFWAIKELVFGGRSTSTLAINEQNEVNNVSVPLSISAAAGDDSIAPRKQKYYPNERDRTAHNRDMAQWGARSQMTTMISSWALMGLLLLAVVALCIGHFYYDYTLKLCQIQKRRTELRMQIAKLHLDTVRSVTAAATAFYDGGQQQQERLISIHNPVEQQLRNPKTSMARRLMSLEQLQLENRRRQPSPPKVHCSLVSNTMAKIDSGTSFDKRILIGNVHRHTIDVPDLDNVNGEMECGQCRRHYSDGPSGLNGLRHKSGKSVRSTKRLKQIKRALLTGPSSIDETEMMATTSGGELSLSIYEPKRKFSMLTLFTKYTM